MLYIFRVDTGTMIQLDMSLALESVDHLKRHIEQQCKLPVSSQVLLVSGGQVLEKNARVCSFSAGTDTNPIFLFTKNMKDGVSPIHASVDYGPEYDKQTSELSDKVKDAQDMSISFSTVLHRANLAQNFHELAKEQAKICESLVHDQHLQQQGWAAVIANLDDLTNDFRRRSERYKKTYNEFIEDYDSYLTFLQSFYSDLEILEKIPVLPVLLPEFEDSTQESDNTVHEPPKLSLLQWIKASDEKSTMDGLFEHCAKGLEQFNKQILNGFKLDMDKTVKAAEHGEMKEVKGLGDRLFGLEQLMVETKRYVTEQTDLAQSFQQNQQRATNIGDTSILPDLCASHRKQLLVMLQNHKYLCDIRRRCFRAKQELCLNLCQRLQWVIYIENYMLEVDHQMSNCHENIQIIRRQLEILRQIHVCPATYLSAVAEVVRRRAFSQAFLLWASELACHLLTIHNDEVSRRKEFQSTFEGHFLNSLFPGMEDVPPSFATQAPSIFDGGLPRLSMEDIEKLKEEVPELQEFLKVPELATITSFFLNRSFVKSDIDKVDERGVEEKCVQVVEQVGLASNLDETFLKPNDSDTSLAAHLLPHLKDLDKGCESETDTEEFEKVCQSPLETNFDKDIQAKPGTQDASTLTEDNLQTSRSEHDKLKSLLTNMALLSRQTIQQLKLELDHMKSFVITEKGTLEMHYESLTNSWENLSVERDNKERAIVQKITVDYESEVQDFRKLLEQKNEELKHLQLENICLEQSTKVVQDDKIALQSQMDKLMSEVEEANSRIEDLTDRLSNMERDKEKSIKEITDRLSREHRAEMENIRARYRFMTMEKSPSEPSAEKTDKDKEKETIRQIKETCEKEKEAVINETITKEAEKWQAIMDEKLAEMQSKFHFEKENLIQEISKNISEDKDHQIDVMRERNKNLILENSKYISTIQQITENQSDNSVNDLVEKVELLEREKCQLEADLSKERTRRFDEMPHDLGASVQIVEGKMDAATSPIKHKERLTKSQTSLIRSGQLSIDSCNIGDAVLVIFNTIYENYTILQESRNLYFLHPGCLELLGLKSGEGEERKMYFTGEVYDKEYCHAKKTENRYKVKKGTRFYRVKVKMFANREARPSIQTSQMMTQSQTTSRALQESLMAETSECISLPNTPTKLCKDPSKSSQTLEKMDTEMLVMQSSKLLNQSDVLFKEIERKISVSAIDLLISEPLAAEKEEEPSASSMTNPSTSTFMSPATTTENTSLDTAIETEISSSSSQPEASDLECKPKSDGESNRLYIATSELST